MDVVYFGSGAFGLPTLERVAAVHALRGVVTQPDRPAGRGKKLTPNPIAAWTQANLPGVPIFKPESVNAIADDVRTLPADAWVVIAFGQKLGQALLADRFAVNLHASLLPRWRGAAPIHHAILAGDKVTGNSVITLAERMDAGFVLGQSTRVIEPTQTTGELHDLLAADGPELVLDVLAQHADGTVAYAEQDESGVTLAGKLGRDDAVLDFARGADWCRRRINGLSPWPGVAVEINGQRVKLLRADAQEQGVDGDGAAIGTLVDADGGLVVCADGLLKLIDVHPAGGKPMAWIDFARGKRVEAGVVLTSPQGHTA